MLLAVAVWALTTWQVAAHGSLRTLDERVERAVVGTGPVRLAEFLADLGNMTVALPVLAAAAAWSAWRRRRAEALAAVLAMALVPALVAPLKALIGRPGPLTEEIGYYPSGHAATAMVAYGAAALLLSGTTRNRAMALTSGVVAAFVTLGAGAGLVLRGYHWPLDVLGSWCLGAILLIGARATARAWTARAGRRPGPRAHEPPVDGH
ncbi:phosphatase PAP2 family protein [Streptomyces sp. SCSIO 30461]|uniref:phosphatase PAP2 family protein n=1 Tax=Streptomyces sp. SCSIO 30461 TaxID=3118085 RepID=UPI0030D1916D